MNNNKNLQVLTTLTTTTKKTWYLSFVFLLFRHYEKNGGFAIGCAIAFFSRNDYVQLIIEIQ
jgi:hypothetical protein